jgi:hypothetical protein
LFVVITKRKILWWRWKASSVVALCVVAVGEDAVRFREEAVRLRLQK